MKIYQKLFFKNVVDSNDIHLSMSGYMKGLKSHKNLKKMYNNKTINSDRIQRFLL
jgi:hypothetical protein